VLIPRGIALSVWWYINVV